MPVALHLAPHPDDEMLGAPGTLLTLHDAGWTVVNLACSLGRPDQVRRRLGELRAACDRTGLRLRQTAHPIAMSGTDDLSLAESLLTDEITVAITDLSPTLVVGPSPHDSHHGHEVVGRATRAALERSRTRPRWWMWNLWGESPTPTLYVTLNEELLRRAAHGLAAHERELARNDYGRLLFARSEMVAVLGAERVFGYGTSTTGARFAEILTEVLGGESNDWPLAAPRTLDPDHPLADARRSGVDLGRWLNSTSPRSALLGCPAASSRIPAAS